MSGKAWAAKLSRGASKIRLCTEEDRQKVVSIRSKVSELGRCTDAPCMLSGLSAAMAQGKLTGLLLAAVVDDKLVLHVSGEMMSNRDEAIVALVRLSDLSKTPFHL